MASMTDGNVESVLPLSPQQQGMLFETAAASGSGIFVEQEVHTLTGRLDLASFERAWQRILERHSVLRTAFVWKSQDEPLQVVLRRVDVPFELHDWRHLSPSERQSRLAEYLEEDRRRGFDLARAPLLRLALLQTGAETFEFVWTQHHILMDGWCRPLIVNEWVQLYSAFCVGAKAELEPTRPYRDYMSWLRNQDLQRAELFWKQSLRGYTETTPLGIEDALLESPTLDDRYGQLDVRVPQQSTPQLQAVCRQRRLTTNTLVQGIWALLLSRYSGHDDVVFGTTVSGRPEDLPGVESIIGLFINTLPFRLKVSNQAKLWHWLSEVQKQHLELRQYEYCSAGQIHQWSEMPGSQPLFESVLVFENYPAVATNQAAGVGENTQGSRSFGGRTNSALTLLILLGSELMVRAIYDRRRLDEAEVSRMLEHFVLLTQCISDKADPSLGTLTGLIPDEQIPRVRPRHGQGSKDSMRPYVAPRGPVEERVGGIAEKVLGLDRIGVNDNFFMIGGHSLLATQLMAQVRQAYDVDLPLRLVFEAPTVVGLAAAIEETLMKEIESLTEEEAQRLVTQ
jgi:acyl carrier protein